MSSNLTGGTTHLHLQKSYTAMVERNQNLTPPGVGIGPEGKARLEMLTQSAPYAKYFLSDLDNVFLGITD